MAGAAGSRFVALPGGRSAYLASDEGQRSLRRGALTQMRGTQSFLRLQAATEALSVSSRAAP